MICNIFCFILKCQVYEDCCRGLECSSYQAKCVPIGGLQIPGKDTRPVGSGPYYSPRSIFSSL